MYNKIKRSLKKHEDGIMQFTLGDVVDEYGEKYSEVYRIEWGNHISYIAKTIENIFFSNMPVKEDMIVGIIIN